MEIQAYAQCRAESCEGPKRILIAKHNHHVAGSIHAAIVLAAGEQRT